MARDLRLGLIVEAIDRASAPLRRISTAVDRISRKTGLARVGRALRRVGRGFVRVGREAVRAGRNIAAMVAGAGAALFALATKTARLGDSIAKMADKMGLGIEELQRLRYAAELAGVDQQKFDMALQRFGRRAAEAAAGTGEASAAFQYLGIQLKDTEGNIRPVDELLKDVAERWQDIENPLLRVRIAQKLFDSEGVDMTRVLDAGRDGLEKMGDEAERLGIMTTEQARRSERFVDNLTRLKQAFKGVGFAIAEDLMPIFERWLIRFREWLVLNRDDIVAALKQALRDVVQLFKDATQAVRDIVGWLADWRDRIAEAFPILGQLFDRLAEWVDRVGWVKIAIGGLVGALSIGLITAIAGLLVPLATLTVAIGVTLVKSLALAGGALLKLGKLIPLANPWVLAFTAIAGAGWLVYKSWDKLGPALGAIWDGVLTKVFDVVDKIRSAFAGIRQFFSGLFEGVISPPGVIAGGEGDAARAGVSSAARSAFETGGGRTRVGGEVRVTFENMPAGARVKEISTENPDVPLEVEAGYAMGTA